jgi:hypothetical protein
LTYEARGIAPVAVEEALGSKIAGTASKATTSAVVNTTPTTSRGANEVAAIENNIYRDGAKIDYSLWQEMKNGAPQWKWPANDGFKGASTAAELKPGTLIDRYGDNATAQYFSPPGTPIGARSLPPGTEAKPLVQYEVLKPLPVQTGEAAGWFGQSGGGVQFKTLDDVELLITRGYLRRVP